MDNYKFKSGDRVYVTHLKKGVHNDNNIKIGITGTVIEDRSNRPWVEFDVDIWEDTASGHTYNGSNKKRTMCMWEDEIEILLPIIKKFGLKGGDIVTYRGGDKRIVDEKNRRIVFLEDFNATSFPLCDFDDDLFDKDKNRESMWDIIKVYRPSTEETFRTERTKQVKEMTLNEVCKELGYEVKIVKGDNENV